MSDEERQRDGVRIDPRVPDGKAYLIPPGHEAQLGDYEPVVDGSNPCGVIITSVDEG